jgi:hypothetical protein
MFFKKKVKPKRGALVYCGEGHKKTQMKLLEDRAEVSGPSPDIWMEGKETWQCPKCHRKLYIQYRIDISKRYL